MPSDFGLGQFREEALHVAAVSLHILMNTSRYDSHGTRSRWLLRPGNVNINRSNVMQQDYERLWTRGQAVYPAASSTGGSAAQNMRTLMCF